jgi:hypothetical protein
VYAGSLRREVLAGRDWRSVDPLALVMSADNAEMVRKGSTREVVPMSMSADSAAWDIVNAWSRTYDS